MRIGVSFLQVFGFVDVGTKPASLYSLYVATHRSRVLLPYGHILTLSTSFTSLCMMGSTQRSLSSLMVFARILLTKRVIFVGM